MSIGDMAKNWVFDVALKKGVVSLAKLIVSFCAAKGISIVSNMGGVAIDTTNELVMTAAINSLLTIVRNWAKTKWPKTFGWM